MSTVWLWTVKLVQRLQLEYFLQPHRTCRGFNENHFFFSLLSVTLLFSFSQTTCCPLFFLFPGSPGHDITVFDLEGTEGTSPGRKASDTVSSRLVAYKTQVSGQQLFLAGSCGASFAPSLLFFSWGFGINTVSPRAKKSGYGGVGGCLFLQAVRRPWWVAAI